MIDDRLPDDVVLVVPCLEYVEADKHVAAIAKGRRIKGKTQTPNWALAHGTSWYTSAPGAQWRRATQEDWTIERYTPAGRWSGRGYLIEDEE